MADNTKQRKGVKYPAELAEYSEEEQADIVQAINNHEDWGGPSFTLTTDEGSTLDLRRNSKDQWVIW